MPFNFQLKKAPKDEAPMKPLNSPDRHIPFDIQLKETPKIEAPIKSLNSPDKHVPFNFQLMETPKDETPVKPVKPNKPQVKSNKPQMKPEPFDFQLMETPKEETLINKPDIPSKPLNAFNVHLKETPKSTIFDKTFEPALPFQGFARMPELQEGETPPLKHVAEPGPPNALKETQKTIKPVIPSQDFGKVPVIPKEKSPEMNNTHNAHLKRATTSFEEFKRNNVEQKPTNKPAAPEIDDFSSNRTAFDSPKKKSEPKKEEIKNESNLLPSQVNSSKGSFKQPQRSRSHSDQIREFVKGIDISSQESPSPIHLRTNKKRDEPQNEYKPMNVSQLRAPFQNDTNNNQVQPIIIDQKQNKPPGFHHNKPRVPVVSKPVKTHDIKKEISVQPPPLSLESVERQSQTVMSPSGKPIKSILSKTKKNNNKKVQFSSLVDVGEAAIPAYVETPPPQNATPPKIPPKDPVNVINGDATKQNNKDINNIVDQINRSSDQFSSNYTSAPLINGGPNLITPSSSPRDGVINNTNRRDALVQAKQRFHSTSTELTNKLTLNKTDDQSYGANITRPKGPSWFSDRPPGEENESNNGSKPNGFKSIPAY